ncbi:YgfZ/GcvT domain-containing protein [Sulfitobacter aestuarii]|uniref:YgfZ/GcvT domain-containing protein n=1 Tax=Sulfitobacter aestuarii TaxID=2161676 RepID=A0ABW5U1U5_9RHOB
MSDARILRLSGPDTRDFLQGLVTNDIRKLDAGPIYAALLTPQGKYIADFFLAAAGDDVLLDVAADQADMLKSRLAMYKLRADVAIAETDLHLHRGLGEAPPDGYADPRTEALGWRAYRDHPQQEDDIDWDALRVQHMVPAAGAELTPDSYILEMGFERLNGVDFRKGCYVGQEVTARMRHKTELRKGLAKVTLSAPVPPGSEITANGKAAGVLLTGAGTEALAYLRYDRAKGAMQAGTAEVSWPGEH